MDNELIKEALLGIGSAKYLVLLFFYLAIEESGLGFPLVADGLLLWAGYQIGQGDIRAALLGPLVIAGSVTGASGVYWLGRFAGRRLLEWLIRKFFRSFSLETVERVLRKRGLLAVAIGRFTPGLLVPTNLGAGMLKIPYFIFAIGATLSASGWVLIYGGMGFLAAKGVSVLPKPLASNSHWLLFVALGFLAFMAIATPISIKRFSSRLMGEQESQKSSERTTAP